MYNKSKIVSAPLSITDMDNDLISKTIYIFDYNNSKIKNNEFLDYISNTGIISDAIIDSNISYNEKSNLLYHYMKSPNFYHLYNFNKTIVDIIKYFKSQKSIKTNGFLSLDEIQNFIKHNYNIINNWNTFYDSIFFLILELIKSKNIGEINIFNIKNTYSKINDTTNISPNICSPLLDNYFWDIYQYKVNNNNKIFYDYYFTKPLYDEKDIVYLLINDSNYIWKILNDTFFNNQFKPFLDSWLKQS